MLLELTQLFECT